MDVRDTSSITSGILWYAVTVTLYSSVITTQNIQSTFHDVISQFDSIIATRSAAVPEYYTLMDSSPAVFFFAAENVNVCIDEWGG